MKEEDNEEIEVQDELPEEIEEFTGPIEVVEGMKPGMPHPLVLFLLICILISGGILLLKVFTHYETFTQNPLVFGMDKYNLDSCSCIMSDGSMATIEDGMITRLKVEGFAQIRPSGGDDGPS